MSTQPTHTAGPGGVSLKDPALAAILGLPAGSLSALAAKASQLTIGYAASGTVTFPAQAAIANGQTLLVGGVTFVAWVSGAVLGGGTVVDLRTLTTSDQVGNAYAAAANANALCTVVATGPLSKVTYTEKTPGTAGNVAITGTLPGTFNGLSGGRDSLASLYDDWTVGAQVVTSGGPLGALDVPIVVPANRGLIYSGEIVAATGGAQLAFRFNGALDYGKYFSKDCAQGNLNAAFGDASIWLAINSFPAGETLIFRAAVGPQRAGSRQVEVWYHTLTWAAGRYSGLVGKLTTVGNLTSIGVQSYGANGIANGSVIRANRSVVDGGGL